MLVVILLYDQLLFRPLVAWADRFRFEQQAGVVAAAVVGARRAAPLAHRGDADRPAVAGCGGARFGGASLRCRRRRRGQRIRHGGAWGDRVWIGCVAALGGVLPCWRVRFSSDQHFAARKRRARCLCRVWPR